jgi:hypothetical protein
MAFKDVERKRAYDREYQRRRWAEERERRKAEYRRRRTALIDKLGATCLFCGCVKRDQLEFDHIDPSTRTWRTRAYPLLHRIRLYEEDDAKGFLRILCKPCNTGRPKSPDFEDREMTAAELEHAAGAPF